MIKDVLKWAILGLVTASCCCEAGGGLVLVLKLASIMVERGDSWSMSRAAQSRSAVSWLFKSARLSTSSDSSEFMSASNSSMVE